jgi:hypothetical protein
MQNSILEARFERSMRDLQPGDVIVCSRGGKKLHSAVLERRELGKRALFTISKFSTVLVPHEYPKQVYWEETYQWLTDTSGGVLLFVDEWEATEKEAAKELVARRPSAKLESSIEKVKQIFDAISDPNKSFQDNAKFVMKKMGVDTFSQEQIWILSFAFRCISRRIWEL